MSESSGARTKLMLLECDSFNINSCQNVKILHASGKQEIWYYLLVSCAALRCWHSWQVVTTWQYLWLTCICYCQSFNCVKQEMFLRYSYTMKCLSDKNLWHVASFMYELIWTNVTRWLRDKLTVCQDDCVPRWLCDEMTDWQDDCVTKWLCDKMTVWQDDCVTRWLHDKTVWQDDCVIK